jgi:hypothetical protein
MKDIFSVLIGIVLVIILIPIAYFILKLILAIVVQSILYVFFITIIALVLIFISGLVNNK